MKVKMWNNEAKQSQFKTIINLKVFFFFLTGFFFFFLFQYKGFLTFISLSWCLSFHLSPSQRFSGEFRIMCLFISTFRLLIYIYILCLASIFFLDLFLHPFFYLLFDFSIQFLSKITMVNSVETIEAMEDKARNTYLMFSKTTIENVNNTIILKQYKWKKRSFNLRTAAKILS